MAKDQERLRLGKNELGEPGPEYLNEWGSWQPWVSNAKTMRCPHGVPGDRPWVRERQRVIETNQTPKGVGNPLCIRVRYEANDEESEWIQYPERLKGIPIPGKCLAYGGYRESSRLTLEVMAVRVERVQEITPEDAEAEGIAEYMKKNRLGGYYTTAFARLWNSINAKRGFSWESNPWVWVVEFSNITAELED